MILNPPPTFLKETMETVAPLLSLLHHPLARRRARHLARTHQAHDQVLAWRVQDSLAEIGLTHLDYSIGGGRMVHIPEVVSVSAGPPVVLDIRMLAGQRAEDFAAHAPTIAYYLGVAEVRVVPLGYPPGLRQSLVIMAGWCGDTPRLAFSRPGW
jgi:hypothetical protein